MPQTDIGSTESSDLSTQMEEYTVDPYTTDASDGQDEYRYQITEWDDWLGYYVNIPELRTAIDAKATWTIGAGFEADEPTSILLSIIQGHGNDTFNEILRNAVVTYHIAGDSFAEIIRDDEGVLVNLKPLDPSSIVIVSDDKGIIKRYEQVEKVDDEEKAVNKFEPNEIFHLSHNRVADEVHGRSIIPSVEWIIKARNQAMADWKTVLHRNVAPLQIHYLDTDDEDKISDYKTKADKARADGENMYVPKGTTEIEVIQSQLNQAASPLQWINQLNDYFFQAVSVPQIIIGNSKEFTDASGKIVYLAFEQNVKKEQLYIEEQVLYQLNLEVELTFPASLQQDLISDSAKQPGMQAAQPNDMTAELEGRK